MKGKLSKKHMLRVLAILCGAGAVISCFTNDIGLTAMILLPLCGVFAWFGWKEYGLIVVALAGIVYSVVGSVVYIDCSTWWERLLMLLSSGLLGSYTLIALGLVGFVTAALLTFGFAGTPSDAKQTARRRIGAAAGGTVIIVVFCNLIMGLAGDPIVFLKARTAVDQYVSRTYPDSGYRVTRSFYDFDFMHYCFYYDAADDEIPAFEVICTVDRDYPVVRYFSTFTLDDHHDEVVVFEKIAAVWNQALQPIFRKSFIEKNHYVKGEHYTDLHAGMEQISDVLLEDEHNAEIVDPKNMPGVTCVVLDSLCSPQETLEALQALAVDLKAEGYRVDVYSFTVHDKGTTLTYRYVETETLIAAKNLDDLEDCRFG